MTKKFFFPLMSVLIIALCLTGSVQAANVTLTGTNLKVGIDNSGGLVDIAGGQGITYLPAVANDFTLPGTPWEFFSIGVAGSFVTNGVPGASANPMGLTTYDYSVPATKLASSSGGMFTVGGASLAYSQYIYFDKDEKTIHFSSTILNTSNVSIFDVVFARGLDPDQDVISGGGFATNNTILGNSVQAVGPKTGLTVRIDPILNTFNLIPGVASISGSFPGFPWATDPYVLLAGGLVNGAVAGNPADYSINMAWNIGTLGAHQSVELDYTYTFSQVPVPASVLMLAPGLLGLLGLRRKKMFA
jgi:hypothetical protein